MSKKSSVLSRKKTLYLSIIRDRIKSKTVVHPATGCHVWTGGTCSQYQYPSVWDGNTCVFAHRWVFEDTNGPIPRRTESGHRVELHHFLPRGEQPGQCMGKACINPAHLKMLGADDHGRETAKEHKARAISRRIGYEKIDPLQEHLDVVRAAIYARVAVDPDFSMEAV